MIKMMVIVVAVFTICWLPFNILILLLNDEELRLWEPLPYCWLTFHWLAMSHSCYNPIIYCYMNARFRGGFLQIVYQMRATRCCCCNCFCCHHRQCCKSCCSNRMRSNRSYETTAASDDALQLQHVNTCSTYLSIRRTRRVTSEQGMPFDGNAAVDFLNSVNLMNSVAVVNADVNTIVNIAS